MPGLRELQRGFAAHLRAPDSAPGIADAVVANGLSGARRLQIYRNNMRANLRSTLRNIYRTVEALVGEEFFRGCADAYIRKHASTSGDLNRFGENFPVFVKAFPPCAHLEYLPDVAQLGWLCHQVFLAEDAGRVDLGALRRTDPEDHAALRFALNPASRLIRSRFPLAAIWDLQFQKNPGELDLNSGGCRLLVMRRGDIVFIPLAAAEFAFLDAVAAGQTLGEAADAGLAADAGFDLGSSLTRMVREGMLTEVHAPAAAPGGAAAYIFHTGGSS